MVLTQVFNNNQVALRLGASLFELRLDAGLNPGEEPPAHARFEQHI